MHFSAKIFLHVLTVIFYNYRALMSTFRHESFSFYNLWYDFEWSKPKCSEAKELGVLGKSLRLFAFPFSKLRQLKRCVVHHVTKLE